MFKGFFLWRDDAALHLTGIQKKNSWKYQSEGKSVNLFNTCIFIDEFVVSVTVPYEIRKIQCHKIGWYITTDSSYLIQKHHARGLNSASRFG